MNRLVTLVALAMSVGAGAVTGEVEMSRILTGYQSKGPEMVSFPLQINGKGTKSELKGSLRLATTVAGKKVSDRLGSADSADKASSLIQNHAKKALCGLPPMKATYILTAGPLSLMLPDYRPEKTNVVEVSYLYGSKPAFEIVNCD